MVLRANERVSANFTGLKPANERASKAARGSSKKAGTKPEVLLRKALWKLGFRYSLKPSTLPGRPDIVLPKYRTVIFVDGDFWHGRDLEARLAKLEAGHNAAYWVKKIQGNVARDRRNTEALEVKGWRVVRVWERDIQTSPNTCAKEASATIHSRLE